MQKQKKNKEKKTTKILEIGTFPQYRRPICGRGEQ